VKSKEDRHQPACMMAHTLTDKIGGIVSRCDLLNQNLELASEAAKQVTAIRKIAVSALEELKEHQRRAESERQKAG